MLCLCWSENVKIASIFFPYQGIQDKENKFKKYIYIFDEVR